MSLAERRAEIGESSFAQAFRLRTLAEEDCLIRPSWVQYWDESDVISHALSAAQSSRHAPRDEPNASSAAQSSRHAPRDEPNEQRDGKDGARHAERDGYFADGARHAERDGYFAERDGSPGEHYDFTVLAVDPAVSQKHNADASALVTLGRVGRQVHCLEAIGAARRRILSNSSTTPTGAGGPT